MRRLEARLLPEDTDYASITGLRLEAAENWEKSVPAAWDRHRGYPAFLQRIFRCCFIWLEHRQKGNRR